MKYFRHKRHSCVKSDFKNTFIIDISNVVPISIAKPEKQKGISITTAKWLLFKLM